MRAITGVKQTVYGISGLGDDGGVTFDTSGGAITTGDYNSPITSTSNASAGTNWVGIATAVSGISSAFANVFKAVSPLPSGCTQVAGPYGVSTQCLAAGQSSTLTSALVPGSSSNLILIGGAVLLVVMLMKR
jgi:hypothetical protein